MISGRSIRLRLIVMLTSTILLVWLVVLVLVYLVAEHEVEEVLMPTWHKTHILQALLLHEVEEELNTAEKVREVTEELGASGLSAYPRLAALLRQLHLKRGKGAGRTFQGSAGRRKKIQFGDGIYRPLR